MKRPGKFRVLFIIVSLVATLLALSGPFLASPAMAASGPTGLTNVTLSIFPEYDNQLNLGGRTVLVMLDGQIVGATAPTTIKFLVPSGAALNSAGSGPRSNYLPPGTSLQTTASTDHPGWDEVSYTLQTSYFVVEYYAQLPNVAQQSFTSAFLPLYPVTNLTVYVQEPRKSTNFSVNLETTPASQSNASDNGFTQHVYAYASLAANQQLGFDLSYTKTDPAPSLSIGGGSGGGLIVIGVIAGLIVLGAVVYMMRRKPSYGGRRAKSRAAARAPAKAAGARFCTECGTKLDPSERYCHQCGAKLK